LTNVYPHKTIIKNQDKETGHCWLMPIIVTTQEEKIRKITVRSQPRETVLETLSQKTHHHKEVVE
jgi:hypothetical protein